MPNDMILKRFFHQVTRKRRQVNKLVKIKDGDEEWVEDEDLIIRRFGKYYKDLFMTTGGRS